MLSVMCLDPQQPWTLIYLLKSNRCMCLMLGCDSAYSHSRTPRLSCWELRREGASKRAPRVPPVRADAVRGGDAQVAPFAVKVERAAVRHVLSVHGFCDLFNTPPFV